MKKLKICALIAILLQTNIWAQSAGVERLAWVAGCWDGSNEKKELMEQWMKPSGGIMLGMSRTVKNGTVFEYEFMKIHQVDGEWFYTAKPSGQNEASFKLKSISDAEAVFENPEHDFPQRIIYRKQADGSLLARIEGTVQGKLKGIDFPYKRSKCAD